MTKSAIKALKRGDRISGDRDDWCVEVILKRRPAILCRSITTDVLKEIPLYEIGNYIKLQISGFSK